MKRSDPESKDFGQKLKRLRNRVGLSSETVSNVIGVSPSTYREWENGRAITGLPYKRLAQVLQVTISQLFDEEDLRSRRVQDAIEQVELAVKKLRLAL